MGVSWVKIFAEKLKVFMALISKTRRKPYLKLLTSNSYFLTVP